MTRPRGFTLIELMIVVVLLAILMMVAAPSVRDITLNARMTGQANDLMTDLAIARAEAVKRGARTALCASNTYAACAAVPATNACRCTNTAWNQGWIIFVDSDAGGNVYGSVNGTDATANLIKVVPAIDGANDPLPNTINSANTPPDVDGPWIGFRPSGVTTPGGLGAATFDICDARTTPTVANDLARNKGRRITVTGTGRASVASCTCDGGADTTTKRCP
jgi:prepilin-type N-terminal cleavage/methylation domain-containing protein